MVFLNCKKVEKKSLYVQYGDKKQREYYGVVVLIVEENTYVSHV